MDAVKKINEYIIEIILYFKQLELIVLEVYIPLSDKAIEKSIQQKIVEIVTKKRRQMQIVILSDLNYTVSNILDRQYLQAANFKRLLIFN